MMKHIRDQDVLAFLGSVLDLLKKIEKTGELEYIRRCMTYFIEAGNALEGDTFVQMVTDNLSALKETDIMTLAEQWQQQGMQQGAFEEKRLIALGMMQEKLPLSIILKLTGLSENDLSKLSPHS